MRANRFDCPWPLLYYWRATPRCLYEEAAGWPVDIVYSVRPCARDAVNCAWTTGLHRRAARGCRQGGRISTFELIETDADLRAMRSVAENGRFQVEANDMGASICLRQSAIHRGPVPECLQRRYPCASRRAGATAGSCRWSCPQPGCATCLRKPWRHRDRGVRLWQTAARGFARCFTARYHNLTRTIVNTAASSTPTACCFRHRTMSLFSSERRADAICAHAKSASRTRRGVAIVPTSCASAAVTGTAEVVRLLTGIEQRNRADQALAQLNALMPWAAAMAMARTSGHRET